MFAVITTMSSSLVPPNMPSFWSFRAAAIMKQRERLKPDELSDIVRACMTPQWEFRSDELMSAIISMESLRYITRDGKDHHLLLYVP
jgi:hypothetical protein